MLNALAELTDEEHSQCGLFVVVLDVHVNPMHWLASLLLSGIHIFHHLLVYSLLIGERQVEKALAVLEPFWLELDSLISV